MMNRRVILMGLAASVTTLATPALAKKTKKLTLHRPRTHETVEAEFNSSGIDQKTYARLNWLLRDVSVGDWKAIDTRLILLAANIVDKLPTDALFIQSGYRTPRTNAAIKGSAKNSFHLKAMAMDIRAPGIPTSSIVTAARAANAGGIGWYPSRGFVHIDTGPSRYWRR
jgi:uncharacterized protein YcbK (DUF882 family)